MSLFTDLIADFAAEKRFLVVAEPWNPAASATVALYYSSHGFTSEPADTPSNQHYESRLNHAFSFQRSLFSQGKLSGRTIPGSGEITLNNEDGALDGLRSYGWGGRRVRIWLGGEGFALGDFGLIFDGTALGIDYGDKEVTVHLRDLQYKFDVEVQATLFAGTGGAEGGADLTGKKKPKALGVVHIEPVYIGVQSGLPTFAVHDGPIVGALKVRDNGVALTRVAAAPTGGQYSVNVANGTIALGALPAGRVTADVIGHRYLSTTSTTSLVVGTGSMTLTVAAGLALAVGMAVRIARTSALDVTWMDGSITSYSGTSLVVNVTSSSGAGTFTDWTIMPWGTVAGLLKALATGLGITSFDSASFTALDAAQPASVGKWLPDGGNALQIMDELADGAGCHHGFTRAGAYQVGRIAAPAGPVVAYDELQILELTREKTEEPNWRTVVKYQRNTAALSLDQVAGSVSDADRQFLTNEWRQAKTESASVLTAYPLSKPIEAESVFEDAAAAAAEATRVHALFSVQRDYFRARLKVQPLSRDLGESVTLKRADNRYGLAAGRDFVIVDISEDMTGYEVELGLWG